MSAKTNRKKKVDFEPLTSYLRRVPAIDERIWAGDENGMWWCKFVLNIKHPLAWNVVQELGHVLNYLSLDERLPTVFKPVSPPPYLNGGPNDFLSWVIEVTDPTFSPATCAKWLEGRLPRPVEQVTAWPHDDDGA
jgi:hypothetical protein